MTPHAAVVALLISSGFDAREAQRIVDVLVGKISSEELRRQVEALVASYRSMPRADSDIHAALEQVARDMGNRRTH